MVRISELAGGVRRLGRPIGMAVIGLSVAVFAVGCSSGSTSPSASPSGSVATPSGSSSAGRVLPPVMVSNTQTKVSAKVGDTIVFSGHPVDVKIAASDGSVLEIRQGGKSGSSEENPSARALKAGSAEVTITNPGDGKVLQTVEVTITR